MTEQSGLGDVDVPSTGVDDADVPTTGADDADADAVAAGVDAPDRDEDEGGPSDALRDPAEVAEPSEE